jgi:hypothetical protein
LTAQVRNDRVRIKQQFAGISSIRSKQLLKSQKEFLKTQFTKCSSCPSKIVARMQMKMSLEQIVLMRACNTVKNMMIEDISHVILTFVHAGAR